MDPLELNDLPPEKVSHALKSLSYREAEILKLISGFGDGYSYTSEEVGHIFKVTRERINQIVTKAMKKIERRLNSNPIHEDIASHFESGVNLSVAIPEYCDDQLVTEKLIDLYVALNGMHRGAGGSGLTVNDDQTCTGVLSLDGAPIQ
jgi:hypothetical protein